MALSRASLWENLRRGRVRRRAWKFCKRQRPTTSPGSRQIDTVNQAFAADQKRLEDRDFEDGPEGKARPRRAEAAGSPDHDRRVAVDPKLAAARLAWLGTGATRLTSSSYSRRTLEARARHGRGRYDAGEISLREYFTRRAAIINAEYDKQIEIAKKKLAAEERLPVDINDQVAALKKATAEEKLRGEISRPQRRSAQARRAEVNDQATQERTLKERSDRRRGKTVIARGEKGRGRETSTRARYPGLAKGAPGLRRAAGRGATARRAGADARRGENRIRRRDRAGKGRFVAPSTLRKSDSGRD